ncbi:hypothetical protein JDW21_21445 [Bacillus subtilis]|nr:hypothetical protein [Bacillus subtilis]WIT27253.1 hypothetical protein [Bacillus phage SPbetaL3]MDD9765732.1 hypothetical protein [Bacillus subtilis]MDD9768688.1 hypothetical protein [Bacillus subtilis]MDD9788885.1 hypothetical protein [Bacillus subtilis]QHF58143.1 hypothetical protein Bateq7PJ16_2337 [Bacillus subtilis]
MMKVIVTKEEAMLLDRYFEMMKNPQLPIVKRRVAKMHYDALYRQAKLRNIDEVNKELEPTC